MITLQHRVLWRWWVPLSFLNTVSLVFKPIVPLWCSLKPELYPFVQHYPRESQMTVPFAMCHCLEMPTCRAWCIVPEHTALRLMQAADWTYLRGKQWAAVSTQVTWTKTPPQKCRNWRSSILHFFNDTLAGWLTSVGRNRVFDNKQRNEIFTNRGARNA